MLRIGIVAGEPSGDFLAADLVRHLRAHNIDIHVEGIGGPQLQAAGCNVLYPMEKLSVMGLFEVAGSYFELSAIRRQLVRHFRASPPDVFIGVDAPDFNLGLEASLHDSGIRTVHYVSPSVWAWRQSRIHDIKRAVDRMLVLFPFEQSIYRQHGIPVSFVGHPLADRIPSQHDKAASRRKLGLPDGIPVIAIMPGSRRAELDRMLPVQLETAAWCHQRRPELLFATSVLTEAACAQIERIRIALPRDIPLHVYRNQTDNVLAAADVAILTSGTITLEAMLYDLPMVVGYRMNWLTYRILRSLVKVRYAALPNLLANRPLVAEFLQQACRPETMGPALLRLLDDDTGALRADFERLRAELQHNAGATAAKAVLELLDRV